MISLVRGCDWCGVSGDGVSGSSFILWESVGLSNLFSTESDFGGWGCSGDFLGCAICDVGWVSNLHC